MLACTTRGAKRRCPCARELPEPSAGWLDSLQFARVRCAALVVIGAWLISWWIVPLAALVATVLWWDRPTIVADVTLGLSPDGLCCCSSTAFMGVRGRSRERREGRCSRYGALCGGAGVECCGARAHGARADICAGLGQFIELKSPTGLQIVEFAPSDLQYFSRPSDDAISN